MGQALPSLATDREQVLKPNTLQDSEKEAVEDLPRDGVSAANRIVHEPYDSAWYPHPCPAVMSIVRISR
jgi:hypothetical protein